MRSWQLQKDCKLLIGYCAKPIYRSIVVSVVEIKVGTHSRTQQLYLADLNVINLSILVVTSVSTVSKVSECYDHIIIIVTL